MGGWTCLFVCDGRRRGDGPVWRGIFYRRSSTQKSIHISWPAHGSTVDDPAAARVCRGPRCQGKGADVRQTKGGGGLGVTVPLDRSHQEGRQRRKWIYMEGNKMRTPSLAQGCVHVLGFPCGKSACTTPLADVLHVCALPRAVMLGCLASGMFRLRARGPSRSASLGVMRARLTHM